MKYFRVPEKLDQKPVYKDRKYLRFLIGKELYTEREIDKHFPWMKDKLECVEVKKSKVYHLFGARFEAE